MTREEAIRTLRKVKGEVIRGSYIDEVYEMAIEALQTPPISQRSMYQAGYRQGREEALKQVAGKLNNSDDSLLTANPEDCKEQKSKLDLISRAEAIDALRYAQHRFTVADEAGGMGSVKWSEDVIYFAAAERVLTELPSADRAKGEPKTGKWINTAPPNRSDNIVCDKCGYNSIARYDYCPNCGSDNRGEDE